MKRLPQAMLDLINTGASARCNDALWHCQLFQQFLPRLCPQRALFRILCSGSPVHQSNNPLIQFLAAALLLAGTGAAFATTHYVDLNSTNATPPYTNWAAAATNIQHAVDAAAAGEEVVVTNGVYGSLRVNKRLNVRSVNGPQSTTIYGGRPCAYLTNDATLSGFTLSNGVGATNGGGVACESLTAVISNCVVRGNSASETGGGAYGGTLNNCALIYNSAGHNGGGAAYCTLNNCVLVGNSATYRGANCPVGCSSPNSGDYADGGGAYYCTLVNCTLQGNSANNFYDFTAIYPTDYGFYGDGGGAAYCTLVNCILDSNVARNTSGYPDPSRYFGDYGRGGGAYGSWLLNCVVFLNGENLFACLGSYAQATDPLFVDNASANLHLQSNSPCINAGNNAYISGSTDLDGNPRIVGGRVDIGAYEYQSPVSQISYAWLQQFGLPIDASTDTADPDGDAVDNYHEWLAGTDPTNRFSSPAQLALFASGTNILLTWSTNAVGFTLQSTTNVSSQPTWISNSSVPVIIGDANVVTNPSPRPQRFYRLIH